ncbi:MAG: hypothetical protein E6G27_15820 [Actinobacteria bacterium]|nr:MAG: hypothetical protein E6G27_15820 [Actinomycetota bacterium]
MAEKSLVNDVAEIDAAAAVVGVDAAVFVFVFEELQADRPMANKRTAVMALVRRSDKPTVPPLPTV